MLAVLLVAAGCRPASERAQQQVAQADAAMAADDRRGAMAALAKATRIDGNNVEAWVKLGTLQLRAGDPTGADQSFQRAQELAPDNVEALANLVVLSIRGEELDRARRYMDALLVLQPDDPTGLLAQGAIALRERKPKEALAVAERLARNNPDMAEAVQLQAQSMGALGRHREAANLLGAWAQTHGEAPAYKDVLLMKLAEERASGDVAGIRATATRLHELDPADPRFALEAARAARAAGRPADEEAIVAALLRAHPGAPPVVRAVLGYWRDMLPPQAATARARSLAEGASPSIRLVVANTLIDQGSAAEGRGLAMPLAGQAVDARTVDAQATVARADLALGQAAAAGTRADRVLAFDPANVPALLVRGQVRLARRDFEGAIGDAQLAQSSDGAILEPVLLLARAYAAQGSRPLAQQAYALGIQRFPDSRRLLSTYLDWLAATNQPREAIQVAGAYARRHRGDWEIWQRYAALCRAADDPCLVEADRLPALPGD